MRKKVVVIGAGLAGVEVAYRLANADIEVVLVEGKRVAKNPAQRLAEFAELVCTNSLKSKNPHSAHGLLKQEMQKLGSLIIKVAYETAVPAGDALAVDRKLFAQRITELVSSHSRIVVVDKIVNNPMELLKAEHADFVVVASGPLTYGGLAEWMEQELPMEGDSGQDLYFYDAIAPVVDADSLDLSKMYFKNRHGEEAAGDYLNIPLDRQQYENFIAELVAAKKVPAKEFEQYKFFESCLPIDTMASRGVDTARFSCMKPIGLEIDGKRPYAVVQLRKENLLGDAYNMVGFQTKLTYGEQKRVFRLLPGMEQAEFLHFGSIHRNSFLHSKKLLNWDCSAKKFPQLFFAGQITGVEGYTESAAIGIYVAQQIISRFKQQEYQPWPVESAMGALVNYIMTADKPRPSNINFGLMPPVTLSKEQRRDRKNRKRIKKELIFIRAEKVFDEFLGKLG